MVVGGSILMDLSHDALASRAHSSSSVFYLLHNIIKFFFFKYVLPVYHEIELRLELDGSCPRIVCACCGPALIHCRICNPLCYSKHDDTVSSSKLFSSPYC